MKTLKLFSMLLLVLTFTLSSQAQNKLDKVYLDKKIVKASTYPIELHKNPVLSENRRILFENNKMRVLEIYLKPGQTEHVKKNHWPFVLYIQNPGDYMDYDDQANITADSRKIKKNKNDPRIIYKDAQTPFATVNVSKSKTIKLVRVEMKE